MRGSLCVTWRQLSDLECLLLASTEENVVNQDLVDRIDSAGIPDALKVALQDLRQQVDTLLPHLSCNQHRIAFCHAHRRTC